MFINYYLSVKMSPTTGNAFIGNPQIKIHEKKSNELNLSVEKIFRKLSNLKKRKY